MTSELSLILHFEARYSVTPIFFFFKRVLLIGQLIIPITSFDKAKLCALLRDSITNLDAFFSLTLKGFKKSSFISKIFNLCDLSSS